MKRWIWTGLPEFSTRDLTGSIDKLLADIGFMPEKIFFLLCFSDFIHDYGDGGDDAPLDSRVVMNRAWDPDAPRWTRGDLKNLVRLIGDRGAQCYMSLMTPLRYKPGPWQSSHLEVLAADPTDCYVNPMKHLADGTLYEDFFIPKMVKVAKELGFNGVHMADGFAYYRNTLKDVDYSNDMVDQFRNATAIKIPEHLLQVTEPVIKILAEPDARIEAEIIEDAFEKKDWGSPRLFKERQEWIWQNARREWIDFMCSRWEQLWGKMISQCRDNGLGIVFNGPHTTVEAYQPTFTIDPVCSIYRTGFDYARLAALEPEAIIVQPEQVGTNLIGGIENYVYGALACILAVRAYAPKARLLVLNTIQDAYEGWSGIRFQQALLEKQIYSYFMPRFVSSDGLAYPCFDGYFDCLAEKEIKPHQWRWFTERTELAMQLSGQQPVGLIALANKSIFERNLSDLIAADNAEEVPIFSRKIFSALLEGKPVTSVANSEEVSEDNLFVPAEEWSRKFEGIPKVMFPRITSNREKVFALRKGPSSFFVFVGNDRKDRGVPITVDMDAQIAGVKPVFDWPSRPVIPRGTKFTVLVPPDGMLSFSVEL